jgi:hypothetical protein
LSSARSPSTATSSTPLSPPTKCGVVRPPLLTHPSRALFL